jgi:signal transduction histidine kinase
MAAEGDKTTFLGSLRTKIILGMCLVLVITVGTFIYVADVFRARLLLEEEEKSASKLSHGVMRAIQYPMLDGEMEEVQAILQRINLVEDISVLDLCDSTGTVKHSGIPDNIGKTSESETMRKALRTNAPVKNIERYGEEKILGHAMPIANEKVCFKCHGSEEKTLGFLLVGTSWEPVERKLEAIRNQEILWFIVCVALAAGCILILLHYLIIIPVGLLTKTTALIAKKGDLSSRVRITANDEIGQLGIAFNHMTGNLEKSRGELLETRAHLEARGKELEDFTYIVSHDLKEPLRGITSFSQFVLEDYGDKLDEEGKGYLVSIKSSGERLKKLIDDLLTLSTVTRDKLSFQTTKASEIIEDAIKWVKYSIDEKNIELAIAQDLPSIYCDKIRMVGVFANLLSNAVKFTDKENPSIEIGYQGKADCHQFYVKDNGLGIEKRYHQKIFEMFQRLQKREEYGGTGAGLHIAQKIMEMHHGKIWVESELDLGSTFYLTLPKKKEA